MKSPEFLLEFVVHLGNFGAYMGIMEHDKSHLLILSGAVIIYDLRGGVNWVIVLGLLV